MTTVGEEDNDDDDDNDDKNIIKSFSVEAVISWRTSI